MKIFFLTLPVTLLLTAMLVEWLVPVLWRRFRGHHIDHGDTVRPREDDSRSKART